jgi:signal transduction histidine kinase
MNWTRLQPTTLVWITFGFCACLVVGAMLWLTDSVIQTEKNRARAEIRADIQERVRLSLWRMDSLGASILIEQNAIPPQQFLTFAETSLPVHVRFETPDGAAIKANGDEEKLNAVCASLPSLITSTNQVRQEIEPEEQKEAVMLQEKQAANWGTKDEQGQQIANLAERASRQQLLENTLSKSKGSYSAVPTDVSRDKLDQVTRAIPGNLEISNPISEFKPIWFDGSFYLIRKGMNITHFAQGFLIDHKALETVLLKEVIALLPAATLSQPTAETDDSLVLASFPFHLTPGSLGLVADELPESIFRSLLAGWIAAIIAVAVAFFLVTNIMKLSERRASFVSAVTHELRTPLTTFRLYSDILQNDAVSPEKRPHYLNTLSREADRLSHLVENVLAFSQIERGSARSSVSKHDIGQLLESMCERFEARLETAKLKLEMKIPEGVTWEVDSNALEHILFNLIDNAAKYAVGSDPAIVTVELSNRNGKLEIKVSDHGPGISRAECKKVFRAFHKSAKQAAETKPGVGLGLALSNRLARSMNGKLSCGNRTDGKTGAVFCLTLSV